MKNVILIGPPGAGKGTQSKKIAEQTNFYHLSTGDIIRKEITQGSDKGRHFSSIISSGALLTDEDIFPIVKQTVENYFHSKGPGIIYDGFPRTISHAEFLSQLFLKIDQKITVVIYISVHFDTLLKRIDGRRVCKKCNASYNIFFKKPLQEEKCDFCQESELEKRSDDSIVSFNKRLNIYQDETYPVLDFYKKQGLVQEIDGEQSDIQVFSQLTEVLKKFI